jgi:very-short-patch-repair endonuclease
MTRNKLIYYNPELKEKARHLRNESTFSEILLWLKIKGKTFGYEFHRQVPLDEYIVDFYCHELSLAIEIDGSSHDNKYDYDLKRQRRLESLGVRFIRSPSPPSKGEYFPPYLLAIPDIYGYTFDKCNFI